VTLCSTLLFASDFFGVIGVRCLRQEVGVRFSPNRMKVWDEVLQGLSFMRVCKIGIYNYMASKRIMGKNILPYGAIIRHYEKSY
jgi:hypothetical protein